MSIGEERRKKKKHVFTIFNQPKTWTSNVKETVYFTILASRSGDNQLTQWERHSQANVFTSEPIYEQVQKKKNSRDIVTYELKHQ